MIIQFCFKYHINLDMGTIVWSIMRIIALMHNLTKYVVSNSDISYKIYPNRNIAVLHVYADVYAVQQTDYVFHCLANCMQQAIQA